MQSRRVCFVTFEVAPFTAGGIGTFMHNTLKAYALCDAKIHVLFVGQQRIEEAAFRAVFPSVFLHLLDPNTYDDSDDGPDDPPRRFMESRFQWYSHVVMRELKRLAEQHGPFDVIEFPDWGGYAFYSAQEKLCGRAFRSTKLAVRLHATDSLLRNYEVRPWGYENLLLADLERKALADADVIVGHLESTVSEYAKRYGFDDAWRHKVVVGPPPVTVGHPARKTTIVDPKHTPILFTSKLQSIKRPELFLQGVCAFALAHPEYSGEIIITAFDFVAEYGARIRSLVPPKLKERVRFVSGLPKEAREALISRSVVVLPNAFEAFCFAAYEASLLGAIVVLNGDNVSFGEGTPWEHGKNCYKFQGTSDSLSATLREIFFPGDKAMPLQPVEVTHADRPYWEMLPASESDVKRKPNEADTRISVIIPHRDAPNELRRLVMDLLEEQAVSLQLIVLDNASESDASKLMISQLQDIANESGSVLDVVEAPVALSAAALLNQPLARITSPYAAVLHPGMGVKPGFLSEAVDALDAASEYDMVVPTAAVVGPRDAGSPITGFFLPGGESLYVGFHINRSCLHSFVMRTKRLVGLRFNEEMWSEPEWELCMRAVSEGARCIVTPDACVYVPSALASALTWRSEAERRFNVEIVRRAVEVRTAGGAVPCHSLGDAELVYAQWFAGVSAVPVNMSGSPDNEEWRRKYEELSSAESVRLALAFACAFKRVMPGGLAWIRNRLYRVG
jgi:glycosyltransferase involved in cell wall biosynthesis